jgi:hypothetical protein
LLSAGDLSGIRRARSDREGLKRPSIFLAAGRNRRRLRRRGPGAARGAKQDLEFLGALVEEERPGLVLDGPPLTDLREMLSKD